MDKPPHIDITWHFFPHTQGNENKIATFFFFLHCWSCWDCSSATSRTATSSCSSRSGSNGLRGKFLFPTLLLVSLKVARFADLGLMIGKKICNESVWPLEGVQCNYWSTVKSHRKNVCLAELQLMVISINPQSPGEFLRFKFGVENVCFIQ